MSARLTRLSIGSGLCPLTLPFLPGATPSFGGGGPPQKTPRELRYPLHSIHKQAVYL